MKLISVVFVVFAAVWIGGAARASADDGTPVCVSPSSDGSSVVVACPIDSGGNVTVPLCTPTDEQSTPATQPTAVCQVGAVAGGAGGSLANTGVSVTEQVLLALGLIAGGGVLCVLGLRPLTARHRR